MASVIQTILLFIQSLPKNSFLDVYGFATDCEHNSNRLLEFNQQNIEMIIKKIKGLKAI